MLNQIFTIIDAELNKIKELNENIQFNGYAIITNIKT